MRFEQEEAPVMRDLPPTPFTEVSYKRCKVDRNWHITCDYQYYSCLLYTSDAADDLTTV